MPRTPRLDYQGATHHAFNRGAAHLPFLADDDDKQEFLDLLARVPHRLGVAVLAYALMTTHFHLLLRTGRASLSEVMQYLLGTFVRRFNGRHGRDGTPFKGRFSNRVVETEDYLRDVIAYIHLNPVRAGIVAHPADFLWSSHRAAIGLAAAPSWLDLTWVDDEFGGRDPFVAFVEAAEPTGEPCPPPSTEALIGPGPLVVRTPVADALALAAGISGVPRPHIRRAKGRPGQFAAWVLAAHAGLTQAETATILRITRAAVSHRIRRFEEWSATGRGAQWRAAASTRG